MAGWPGNELGTLKSAFLSSSLAIREARVRLRALDRERLPPRLLPQ